MFYFPKIDRFIEACVSVFRGMTIRGQAHHDKVKMKVNSTGGGVVTDLSLVRGVGGLTESKTPLHSSVLFYTVLVL